MNYYTDVLKKYAVFDGRSQRKEYWMFTLFHFIITIILSIIAGVIDSNILSILYGLAVFIPSLAVSVRRLHDTNRTGWWVLINIIPLIGLIVFIIFMVLDSTPGDNTYGPNPKAVTNPVPVAQP